MLGCQFRDGLAWAVILSPAYVAGRQLLAALRALERSTGFPKGTGLLLDARALRADARGHTPSELSATAVELGILGIGRCAVVPTPARIRHAERFVDVAGSESLPIAVFLEPAPAVRWLVTGKADEPVA